MITSTKNEKVKAWKKLHRRKERIKTETFLVEGFHLLEEAYKSGWRINEIIAVENIELPEWTDKFSVIAVSEAVMKEISQTMTPQGVAATIQMKKMSQPKGEHVLLIDRVQDPGNLGTIIRTADAAGFDAVVLGEGTVDLYNDKVVRATQGSLFHLPVLQANLAEMIPKLKEEGFTVWATALKGAEQYNKVAVPDKLAMILGNEGSGVDEQLLELADQKVNIPIYGKAESLNVGIAAGILMYYVKG